MSDPRLALAALACALAAALATLPSFAVAAPDAPRDPAAPPSDTSAQEAEAETYVNPLVGFRIEAPADWLIAETGRRVPMLHLRPRSYKELVVIHVSVHRRVGPDSPREWTDWMVANYGKQFINVEEETPVYLGSEAPGYRIQFQWRGEVGIKEQWTGIIRGRQTFMLRAFGTVDHFDRLRDTLEGIIGTFALIEPVPPDGPTDDIIAIAGEEPATLDPALHEGADGAAADIIRAVFGGLVRLDEDNNVVPDLAESWEVSEDGRVYNFKIRLNSFFHNGDWVTAADVKRSWERAVSPSTASPTALMQLGGVEGVDEASAGIAEGISGVEALSLFRLRVRLKSPSRSFMSKLAHPAAALVHEDNVEYGKIAEFPIGAGPYAFVGWSKGQVIALKRNYRYHLKRPKPASIVFLFGGGGAYSLYDRGSVDIAPAPPERIEQTRDPRSDLYEDVVTGTSLCQRYLTFDTRRPPFDDVNVRRAFAIALDVDRLIALTLRGTVERAATLIPHGVSGHDAEAAPFAHDVAAARALIAESALAASAGATLLTAVDNASMTWMWREYLALDVRPIGGPASDLALARAETWCPGYIDGGNYLEAFLHSRGSRNRFGYENPEIDALLAEADAGADLARREDIYRSIEEIARREWVVIPLWRLNRVELVRQRVVGYRPPMSGARLFGGVYVEQ